MPWHPLIDIADEALRGDAAIGTTGRGVGPCFTDKVARIGIRIGDLIDPEAFRARLEFVLPYKNKVLQQLYGLDAARLRRRLRGVLRARRAARAVRARHGA